MRTHPNAGTAGRRVRRARHCQTLDASELQLRPNHTHVMRAPEVMAARFADYPEAVAETVTLADTLRFT